VFIGSGTTLADVRRVYNEFLDAAYQNSTALNNDAKAYSSQASAIDKTLSDKTTGMSSVLSAFFAAVQTSAANPSDVSARQVLLTSAQTFPGCFAASCRNRSSQAYRFAARRWRRFPGTGCYPWLADRQNDGQLPELRCRWRNHTFIRSEP
jgi:hypothetical protein